MKRAAALLLTLVILFSISGCAMALIGMALNRNEDTGNKDIADQHIAVASQKVSLATEAFSKTATAARYVITYLEIKSGSPEILRWMKQLEEVYPQTFRLELEASEAVKSLTQDERIKYGYPELIRQEHRTNANMNQLRSMLHTHGYPSIEFGILWDRMEKKAFEEKLALDDKELFKKTVLVKDDPIDTFATLSSDGLLAEQGQLRLVSSGNFLQSLIHKKTGRRSYYVHNIIRYRSSQWSFYSSVNYQAPDGPKSKPLLVINRDTECFESKIFGCTFVEHVGFEVDDKLLRFVAKQYQPGARRVWKFKLIPQNGEDYKDGILLAEVAGFLDRVDDYAWRSLTMLQRGKWKIPPQKPAGEDAAEEDAKYLCAQYQICPRKPELHPDGWLY